MIKLIVSDLDGTLLQNGAQTLSSEMLDLIKELQARGIHYASASGRQYANQVSLYGEELAQTIPIISDNGAMYVYKGKRHLQGTFSPELVKHLVAAARSQSTCDLTLSALDTLYFEDSNADFLHHMREVMNNKTKIVPDLAEVDDTIIKMAVCDFNGTQNCEEYFRTLFEKECVVVTSGNAWLDFIPHGVNKGTALKHLIDEMGIKPEECMAFGDQWNDIEMLELAGISYAMKNSAPGVAEHATHMTNSVEKTLSAFLRNLQ